MKKVLSITIFGTALLMAFSACTQDEIVGGDDSLLPDGQYPLLIGDISIVAQSSEEPWTRVAENTTDGGSSVWENGDKIGVRLDGGDSYYGGTVSFASKGQYSVTVDESNGVSLSPEPGEEIYFRNTYNLMGVYQYDYNRDGTDETYYAGGVMAWYPAEDGEVQLADQSERFAYILEGKMGSFPTNSDHFKYTESIPLVFNHMLSKVRVKLDGDRASQVSKVEVFGYTSCTHSEVNYTKSTAPYRTISTEGAQRGWITMHKATYNGSTYWEANLVPGTIQNNFVRLNGTTEVPISTLTELRAGNLHTVTVTVRAYPSDATQITAENAGNISDNGNYYVTGNLASAINITGGSPHIYLYNANVNVSSGSAISIAGNATPTIHVVGAGNSVSSNNGAGIYVAQTATVTITGRSREDELTATGGGGGAGIGGYVISNNNGANCGNINISSVTVYSCGSISDVGDISAGIGSASGASCGTITIDNATVHAYGTSVVSTMYTPGIGCGVAVSGKQSAIPIVNISNQSEIHAHRGGVNADYIGGAGFHLNTTNGTINLGGGTCTDSTVYCYTGTSTTTDTVVEY